MAAELNFYHQRIAYQARRVAALGCPQPDPLARMRRDFDAEHGRGSFDQTRQRMVVAVNLLRNCQ